MSLFSVQLLPYRQVYHKKPYGHAEQRTALHGATVDLSHTANSGGEVSMELEKAPAY